jgi:hypothetical protein
VPGISKSKRKGVSIPRSGSRSGKTILSLAARSVNNAESCIRTAATASMRRHGARRTPDAVLFRLFTGFSSVCVRRNPFRRVGFRRELSRGVVTRRMFIKLEAAGIAPAAPIYQFVLTIASVEPLVSDLFSITQTPAVLAYLARFGPTTPELVDLEAHSADQTDAGGATEICRPARLVTLMMSRGESSGLAVNQARRGRPRSSRCSFSGPARLR